MRTKADSNIVYPVIAQCIVDSEPDWVTSWDIRPLLEENKTIMQHYADLKKIGRKGTIEEFCLQQMCGFSLHWKTDLSRMARYKKMFDRMKIDRLNAYRVKKKEK